MGTKNSLVVVALLLDLSATARAGSLQELLVRFSPVVVQSCQGRADYITRFDYDGNWNGDDNWENLDRGYPLEAYSYTAAVETSSHVYLTYAFFHPRDWWPVSLPLVNHENDLEGVLVVVEKGDRGLRVLLMETVCHLHFKRYSSHPAMTGTRLDGNISFEGEHPIVDVEAYKHGITAFHGDLTRVRGVIYRYDRVGREPSGTTDRNVGYAFIPIEESLWFHRFEVGPDKAFAVAESYPGGRYGARFNGTRYKDHAANAPWNWADTDDSGLDRGDWFLNPAKTLRVHYPEKRDRFSLEYLVNPFSTPRAPRRVGSARAVGVR